MYTPKEHLFEAATELSAVLSKLDIAHAVTGGTALLLLGSDRSTRDVDILVDAPCTKVRSLVLENSDRFTENEDLSFVYANEAGDVVVPFGILQHGQQSALRMPDVHTAPILVVDNIPIIHPSLLICLKMSRWSWMSDSSRPASALKAQGDLTDIMFLLRWLVEKGERINFHDIDEDRLEKCMRGFQKLRAKYPEADEMLKAVLD
ncbi:hypothetical protein Dda_2356 [Drechslerella dactyloides]|uniref:Nucleotidyl transferase n=1 Tax=Drechslerella dactyloides TaxID=74499 RepID=A0AAD6NMA2_DREDA|nr:hypothetical protein Dda_2356 [Drechslerella dactyloides]